MTINWKFDWDSIFGTSSNSSTTITYEKVLAAHETTPKRICLKTCHANALKEVNYDDSKWALFLPFEESIKKIFESETDLKVYKTKQDKFWCPIKTEEEYKKASEFKTKYNTNVFMRDNLDLSVSLSEHYEDEEKRTEIGELEFQAKYNGCEKSMDSIVTLTENFIKFTPYYKDIDFICAVPSSDPTKINLPNKIVEKISNKTEIENISDKVSWKKEKAPLKEVTFEDKWMQLEQTDMVIDDSLKDKNIILLDDLYQSGTTIQYVAMKLKEAGVNKVYGLTIVKSRKDTDNK